MHCIALLFRSENRELRISKVGGGGNEVKCQYRSCSYFSLARTLSISIRRAVMNYKYRNIMPAWWIRVVISCDAT